MRPRPSPVSLPRRTRTRAIAALLTALATLGAVRATALACAACGCGDPTLTGLGTEKPFRDRVRAGVEWRHRTDAFGDPAATRVLLREQRAELAAAWAPTDRLFLLATLPLLERSTTYAGIGERTTRGVGDLELRAKLFLWQERAFSPRHLVATTIGAKLPTSPLARDGAGFLLPMELQTGSGTFDPTVGLSYAHFAGAWSLYASLHLVAPLYSVEGHRASRSLRGTAALQRALGARLALRLGADGRADGRALESGRATVDSGGGILFAAPELLYAPMTDLIFTASARLPVLNRLHGRHDEGAIFALAAVYDF